MVTAIFDGKCIICQQTRRTIVALDWLHRVEFVDIHDRETVNRRYPELDFETAMGQLHVADDSGQLTGGFLAIRRMLREVLLGFPVWAILRLPGMTWLGSRVYRWVARHRYQINRLFGVKLQGCDSGACKIPN